MMVTSAPAVQQASKSKVLLDLMYVIEVSVLHQRFYERVHKGIAFLSLLSGAAAFVTIFKPNSVVVTVAGVTVGVLALAEQVYDFRGKAAEHALLCKRFTRLKSRSAPMTAVELEAAIDRLAQDTIPLIQGLRAPAFNNNLVANGFEALVRPLSRWERLLRAFA